MVPSCRHKSSARYALCGVRQAFRGSVAVPTYQPSLHSVNRPLRAKTMAQSGGPNHLKSDRRIKVMNGLARSVPSGTYTSMWAGGLIISSAGTTQSL